MRKFTHDDLSMNRRRAVSIALIVAVSGCLPLPGSARAPTEIWTIWSSPADGDHHERMIDGVAATVDFWIALDSASFRPTVVSPATAPVPRPVTETTGAIRRLAMVTSFQGARYHPEVVRGVTESPDLLGRTAASISTIRSNERLQGLVLDFQEMTAEDVLVMVDASRSIADSARTQGPAEIAMIIPGEDTAGYPARILARVADVLLVRLFPEHGIEKPPGPIISPSWFARRLGTRAGEAGVNRIVAGIPADGILWNRKGGARRVSYVEALSLADSSGTPIVRDPASGNLHASSSRDGWDLWVVDHELIERLLAEARKIGVTRFALFGLEGADPQLWQRLPQLVRRL